MVLSHFQMFKLEKNYNGIITSIYRKQSWHRTLSNVPFKELTLNKKGNHQNANWSEILNTISDLLWNEYLENLSSQTIEKSQTPITSVDTDKETQPKTKILPYLKIFSENPRRIDNQHQIRTVFTLMETLWTILTKQPRHIPSECGDIEIRETQRPIETRIKEHKKNSKVT